MPRATRDSVGYRPIARSRLVAMLAAVVCGGAIFGFGGFFVPKVVVSCARAAIAAPAQCTLTEQGHFSPMQSSDFLLDGARVERVTTAPGVLRSGGWSRMRITTTTQGPLSLPEYDVPSGEDAGLRAEILAFQATPTQTRFESGYSSRYLSWAGALFTALGVLAVSMYVARKGGIRPTLVPG